MYHMWASIPVFSQSHQCRGWPCSEERCLIYIRTLWQRYTGVGLNHPLIWPWQSFLKRTVSVALPDTHSAHKLSKKKRSPGLRRASKSCANLRSLPYTHPEQNGKRPTGSLFPVLSPLSLSHLSFSWVLGSAHRGCPHTVTVDGLPQSCLYRRSVLHFVIQLGKPEAFFRPRALQTDVLTAHHCFLWFISSESLNHGPHEASQKEDSTVFCGSVHIPSKCIHCDCAFTWL